MRALQALTVYANGRAGAHAARIGEHDGAVGLMALAKRFPFAALVGFWLLAAGVTFVDGRLIPFMTGVFVLGMVVSFLLGYVRDAVQARIGLAVVLIGAAIRWI